MFDAYFSPLKTRLVVAAERLLARGASALVAVTARVRRDVLARGIGGDDQVVVVSLGLDLDPLVAAPARRGELRRELGLAPAVPLVGIVARLVRVKAHEVFLAAAKAMAAGRPVVSTRAGGVEDVVTDGETGVIVPIGDAPAVARAVVDLLEDPARAARLGAAACASVVARFGSRRLVGDIDALYQRLLADRGVRV